MSKAFRCWWIRCSSLVILRHASLLTHGQSVSQKLHTHGYDLEGFKSHALVQSALEVDESLREMYKWLAVILGILWIIVVIFICMASKQIKRTTALVSEGTRVVKNSPGMVFVPMAIYCCQIVTLAVCAFILAYIWTDPAKSYESAVGWAEDVLERTNSSEIQINVAPTDFLWYETGFVAFGAIWTYFFFEAIETTIISGCVVYFYFIDQDTAGRRDAQYADNQTDFITLSMTYHVVTRHLGTMAFGSLILALVEVARILLEWIDRQSKEVQDTNVLLKYALKCCKCFLVCFERSIKFISSYAYTFVIMESHNFCRACTTSYSLLKDYAVQISVNTAVCIVLYWIQSISTSIMCALLGYFYIIKFDAEVQSGVADPLDYWGALIPVAAILILSFWMARSFAGVYEQTVTALTVCVLQDITYYRPTYIQRHMYEAFELEPAWGDRKPSPNDMHSREHEKLPLQGRKNLKRKTTAPLLGQGYTELR